MTLLAAVLSETSITLPVWALLAIASVAGTAAAVYFPIVRKLVALDVAATMRATAIDETTKRICKETDRIIVAIEHITADITILRNDMHMLQNMMTAPALQAEMKERRLRLATEAEAVAHVDEKDPA